MTALKRLHRLAVTIEKNEAARAPLIAEARSEGATWEQIAAALQMSRAGVINLHAALKRDDG